VSKLNAYQRSVQDNWQLRPARQQLAEEEVQQREQLPQAELQLLRQLAANSP